MICWARYGTGPPTIVLTAGAWPDPLFAHSPAPHHLKVALAARLIAGLESRSRAPERLYAHR